MRDNISVIYRFIGENRAIRAQVKFLDFPADDNDAEKPKTDLTHRCWNLEQSANQLEEGLKRHSTYEEQLLGDILGHTLLEALNLEHREILEQVKIIKSLFHQPEADLNRTRSRGQEICQALERLRSLVEKHSLREDAIFELLQKLSSPVVV